MKQLILLLASLLPIAGMAAEAGDTTIVVKGKNVVIPDSVISSLLSSLKRRPMLTTPPSWLTARTS